MAWTCGGSSPSSYCFPMLRAHAVYEQDYLLGTSIARPLIAAKQVEVARQTGADAVGHGATGKGNDQVRFELTYMALAPDLKIIAPWKDPTFELRDRESAIDYAEAHGVPVPVSKTKIYSQDRNLWHISHEGAEIEHPDQEPNWDKCLTMTQPLHRTPKRQRGGRGRVPLRQPGAGQPEGPAARGRDRRAERDRRQARRRRHRPGREPAGRHEVPRRVRDARRHDPLRGPQVAAAAVRRAGHAALRPGRPACGTPSWSTTASGSTRCGSRCRRSSTT